MGTDLLIQVLSHFVYEIRRKDGKDYPPASIYGIMCDVIRYLRDDCNRPDLNFLNRSNKEFHYLRRCIDSRMQELTCKGVGICKRRADPVVADDEEQLWCSNIFSTKASTLRFSDYNVKVIKIFYYAKIIKHDNILY